MSMFHDSHRLPLTANFHFIRSCNLRCKHCYATFLDDPTARPIQSHAQLLKISQLLGARYEKVTFVGGEPTLYPGMPDMLAATKAEGALTNLVTNGSRIDPTWIGAHADVVDLLTVSIDSAADATHRAMGRATPGGETIPADYQIALADAARAAGVRYKLNTVVTTLNQGEDVSTLVVRLGPERWKLLQAAPVEGQNDAHITLLTPTREAFDAYVNRHRAALARLGATGIRVVPEPIEAIRGSYVMVDPQGRFFDSAAGRHRYSRPILEIGHDAAFAEVDFDRDKFDARGGRADYTLDQTAGAA